MSLSLPQLQHDDPFAEALDAAGQTLDRLALTTLQLNLGKACNLACHHCHVEAGPRRTEVMSRGTMQQILGWIDRWGDQLRLREVDLTGGAPEMNPHFRELVEQLRRRGLHTIDRCNLTILLEPEHVGLASFLAEQQVEIVASLPCYLQENVDRQRGRGVYDDSIRALQMLNALGYGQEPHLRLDLVYNPVGYSLPPDQQALEADYKQRLAEDWGVAFHRLWTITNMPIRRFEHALRRDGRYDEYLQKLRDAHRVENASSVMCRTLVSVGWQGAVYDCDFNQMLQMPLEGEQCGDEHAVEAGSRKLWEFTPAELIGRRIRTGVHCFGCTAGAGSSCTGALS